VGIQCALCHSTVDDSFAPGIGRRLDGWPNQDLNVGAILDLAPDGSLGPPPTGLAPVAALLSSGGTTVDVATVRTVLKSWGPGKFDAELFMDGPTKAFNDQFSNNGPNNKTTPPISPWSGATLIPPAFGMAGVNLHTWTGWGSVTYWNAFVANLEMHGTPGTFFDPRLDDPKKFPIAAANHFGHVQSSPELDRITRQLPALHFYQLAIPAPKAAAGSFNADAAARGKQVFEGQGKCATCHVGPTFTEPGWNMHTAQEIGIDDFQASRSPDDRYRTTPLAGRLFWRTRGFYHDGRFATLQDVVNHYNTTMNLGLNAGQMSDLVEYLKSI
jgi:hypothetical protein